MSLSNPPPVAGTSGRGSLVRKINIALVVSLVGLLIWYSFVNTRFIRFGITGSVGVDGSTFYLQPDDNYLTQLVLCFGEYEPTETRLVRDILQEGDTFVDVGANVGWYTVHAAKIVGPKGQVVAFEPEPSNLALLRRNVNANHLQNVTVEGVGLSNSAGSFKLYLEKNNLGMHSLVEKHGGNRFITIPTVRFDDYWHNKGKIKLIKIDTEGAEGMILDGMRETIERNEALELIVEFAPRRLERSGYPPDKVLGDLYRSGFKASLIDESTRCIVPLGAPLTAEMNLAGDDPVTNLHFKR